MLNDELQTTSYGLSPQPPLFFQHRGAEDTELHRECLAYNCLNHDLHDLRIDMIKKYKHEGMKTRRMGYAMCDVRCATRRKCRDGALPVSTTAPAPTPPPPPHAVIAGLTRNPVVFGGLRVVARNDRTGCTIGMSLAIAFVETRHATSLHLTTQPALWIASLRSQ